MVVWAQILQSKCASSCSQFSVMCHFIAVSSTWWVKTDLLRMSRRELIVLLTLRRTPHTHSWIPPSPLGTSSWRAVSPSQGNLCHAFFILPGVGKENPSWDSHNTSCIAILPLTTLCSIYLFMCLLVHESRRTLPCSASSVSYAIHGTELLILVQWNQADKKLETPALWLLQSAYSFFFILFVSFCCVRYISKTWKCSPCRNARKSA